MTSSVGLTTSSLPTMSTSVAGSSTTLRPTVSAENSPSSASCDSGAGRTGGAVLYVSGEESERQVKLRGERLDPMHHVRGH